MAIIKALAGKSIPAYHNGLNFGDWLFVGDHARRCWTIRATIAELIPSAVHHVPGRTLGAVSR
jgi:dTDP-D-glucose 4,6-dehydratase